MRVRVAALRPGSAHLIGGNERVAHISIDVRTEKKRKMQLSPAALRDATEQKRQYRSQKVVHRVHADV